jgi:cytochrome d ubiquinol oxidase subunit II
MVEFWYGVLALMLAAYTVLDGWNIGAGVAYYAIGTDQAGRGEVLRALGSSWSWHEVWLLAFGGTLMMAFPAIFAATFAGFYLAFMLMLWLLILRGVSLEVRAIIDDPLWRTAWDAVFCWANIGLAALIGIAAANVLRGVPLDAHGDFALPFFTDFGIRGQVGLIDWYTLPAGLFTVLALGAHGSSFVALRTTGAIHDRAARSARRLWLTALLLLPLISAFTAMARGDFFPGLARNPVAWLCLGAGAAAAGVLCVGLARARMAMIFAGGATVLASLVAAAAAASFPIMLASTLPEHPSLSAFGHASALPGLSVAVGWGTAGAALIVVYAIMVLRYATGGPLQPGTSTPRDELGH